MLAASLVEGGLLWLAVDSLLWRMPVAGGEARRGRVGVQRVREVSWAGRKPDRS